VVNIGLGAALERQDRALGVRRSQIKGGPMIWACVPGKVIARITAAISSGFGVAWGRRIVERFGVIPCGF
jgi:hypothetical protein